MQADRPVLLQIPARQGRSSEWQWDLRGRPLLMGILNINDDSFSRDGCLDGEWAIRRARELLADGADILDAGAESARPNRPPISEAEELRRLQPLLEAWPDLLRAHRPPRPESLPQPLLSINTWRAGVMRRVLATGVVDLLNDMSGLAEESPARLAAEAGCALLVMHTVGLPKQDHRHIRHENVLAAVREFFRDRLARCARVGLAWEQVVLDPGLGFAKTAADDLRLLRELTTLQEFSRPLLLPISRKGFIGRVLELPDARERDAGTVAALVGGLLRGGHIYRMHDVRAAAQVRATLQAVG